MSIYFNSFHDNFFTTLIYWFFVIRVNYCFFSIVIYSCIFKLLLHIFIEPNNMTCHAECYKGCWGPGNTRCLQCRNANYKGHCLTDCTGPLLFNVPGSSECLDCHSECNSSCVERVGFGYLLMQGFLAKTIVSFHNVRRIYLHFILRTSFQNCLLHFLDCKGL